MKTHPFPFIGAVALLAFIHGGCCKCANPTATPQVSPTPTPAPSPTPTAQCNLPPVPLDQPRSCRYEPPLKFEDVVVRAQNQVGREHPELFDGGGRVISTVAYTGWVATVLRSYGYCSVGGSNEEVGIKNTNDFDELYNIVTSGHEVWTGYQFTCRPPLF